ncbi:uncharacterized protein [Rutidosis leptorrhynchoides]|uniref:uncharacterized protein n=1 Tax=Rutidosis leptorrhynchoides TaxID=125765 RepID=UPI003A98E46B
MFKSGKWGQNNKIKVMFQLQFQATQVPKVKGKGLMVSLIPGEIGKPVAKSERVPVVDGTCTWEDPMYEMVKLVRNQKTEKYKEKIYYFNVQSGSSKSGYVGEVGVDFASFAETTEPFNLSLPLTTSDSGAILHVYIQKMKRTDEQREYEEDESLKSDSVRSKNQASDCSENANMLDFAEDHAAVKKNLKPVDKKGDGRKLSPDWSSGSLSDRSMTDILNSPDQNYQNQGHNKHTEASKNTVEKLKSDVSRLERQAELSELELDSLRKQILKENKRGQDLSKKVDELMEEKEDLETECDRLKSLTLNIRKTEESNTKLVLQLKDLDRTLGEKDEEIFNLTEKVKERQMRDEAIEELYAEIELERKEKEELKIHMEEISVDYKFLLQENDDMSFKLEETQREKMKMQNEYSNSLAKVKEYEVLLKRLEEKFTSQALELAQSFDTISDLETHIKSLEKELEKQGHDFEDDVADLMKAKIEQEERVVQAEEALRKSKLTNNADFENLRVELEKSRRDLLLMKDTHNQEVQKLCEQIDEQDKQIRQMSLELETCIKQGEDKSELEESIREKAILVTEYDSLKKEMEKLQKESTSWTSLMSEKNVIIRTLQSELKKLRGDHNGLQQRFLVIESEKVNLTKEVSRLEIKTMDQQKHLSSLKASKEGTTSKHNESRSISKSAKSNNEQKLSNLLSEMSSLDEKNKHMESELKEMQEKYLEVSLRFAEVEGERQQLVMELRNLRNGKK